MTHVTRHAIDRYRQRVADLTDDEIAAILDSPTIRDAIAFGCRSVKLGTGHRVVLRGDKVVTVNPARRPMFLTKDED